MCRQSAKIPSPDKYAHQRKDFFDPNKKSKIYTNEKKSMMDDLEKASKQVPGVGKYNTTAFDEKRLKPARGVFKVQEQKITMVDEVINIGKSQPVLFYEPVKMVSPFEISQILI